MKAGRITIAGLIALIAIAGLAMAGLRYPSSLVAQVSMTAALTGLLIATLAAIVSPNRAPAMGFAIFGWGYLILVFAPGCADAIAPWLLSSRLIDEMYVRLMGLKDPMSKLLVGTSGENAFEGAEARMMLRLGEQTKFIQFRIIGHATFTVAHGLFGGVLALILARGRRGDRQEKTS